MFKTITRTKNIIAKTAVLASAIFAANAVLAAPGETSGSGGGNGNFTWSHGNSNAGMTIYARGNADFIHNRQHSNSTATYAEMWGGTGLVTDISFLKSTVRIFDISTYANPRRFTPSSWNHNTNVNVKVNGYTVIDDSNEKTNNNDTERSRSYDLPDFKFFDGEATFVVGFVPVTVSGSVKGEVGIAADVTNKTRTFSSMYWDGFTNQIKPEVAIVARAGAEVFGGLVGANGAIDIIRADNTTRADLYRVRRFSDPVASQINYYGSTFNTSSLSTGGGELNVEALFGAVEEQIARWDGYNISNATYWHAPFNEDFQYTTE